MCQKNCKNPKIAATGLIAFCHIAGLEYLVANIAVHQEHDHQDNHGVVQHVLKRRLAQEVDPENSKRRTRHNVHLYRPELPLRDPNVR